MYMVISGGFMEVRPEKVIVLADACERSDEIDMERAAGSQAEGRRKAQEPDCLRLTSPERKQL